nr:MAG: hypothetical protein DIU74_03780 [Pseudomonadota bacterium]
MTDQPSVRGIQFDQHVDEGLVDRLLGLQADYRAAVAAPLHHGTDLRGHAAVFDTRPGEGLGLRNACSERIQFALFQRHDIDLGLERLPERGQHAELAQPGRISECRRQHKERTGKQFSRCIEWISHCKSLGRWTRGNENSIRGLGPQAKLSA